MSLCPVLASTVKAKTSIVNYISGANILHGLRDMPVTAFQAAKIKMSLRGIARLHPHCPRQAASVSPHILLDIWQVLDQQNNEHVVFWALFLVAFFQFARKSNLVITDLHSKPLRRSDVVIGTNCILVTFN